MRRRIGIYSLLPRGLLTGLSKRGGGGVKYGPVNKAFSEKYRVPFSSKSVHSAVRF